MKKCFLGKCKSFHVMRIDYSQLAKGSRYRPQKNAIIL